MQSNPSNPSNSFGSPSISLGLPEKETKSTLLSTCTDPFGNPCDSIKQFHSTHQTGNKKILSISDVINIANILNINHSNCYIKNNKSEIIQRIINSINS